MDLSKYTDYFHDGTLINFKHIGKTIEVSMISADIPPEHMKENMPPLNENRIAGKLYLESVREIKIDNKHFTGILKKIYDSGDILDFELFDHKVLLGVEWTDYPPKPRKSNFSTIEIEAEKIRWENTSDLS